jgi:hypothetical protein
MEDTRITKVVTDASYYYGERKRNNWCSRLIKLLNDHNLRHILDKETILASSAKYIVKSCDIVFFEKYKDKWYSSLHNDVRKNPLSKNKLSSYRNFKNTITTEHYIKHYMTKSNRRALAQFHFGVAPIRVETDRYSAGSYIPRK